MCDVGAYKRAYISGPDAVSIVGGRELTSTSSTYSLGSLGRTINFIDNWLQFFENNDGEITGVYKNNIIELFDTITLSITPTNTDDYK